MKGTPETPQCGFSRASIQILGLQGVNPQKFTAFNVLEDEELRQGVYSSGEPLGELKLVLAERSADWIFRNQGVLRVADHSAAVC